jgi:hypothetical protein
MIALILTIMLAQNATPGGAFDAPSEATAEFPPLKVHTHPHKLSIKYDEIRDRGSFKVELGTIIASPLDELSVDLSIHQFFSGRERKPIGRAGKVSLYFDSKSKTWEFLKFHSLTLLVNGSKRLSPESDPHKGDVELGYVTEYLWYDISVPDLLVLANAESIEGEIGVRKFQLSKDQLEAIRDYAARLGHTNAEIARMFMDAQANARLASMKQEVESALSKYDASVSKLDKRNKRYNEQLATAGRVLAGRIKPIKKNYDMTEKELTEFCKGFKGLEALLKACGYK